MKTTRFGVAAVLSIRVGSLLGGPLLGGFGEAERSERGGGGGWEAEGRSEPSESDYCAVSVTPKRRT